MSTTAQNEANNARILHIAVKQRNEDGLETLLFAVSNPNSPKYGQHLSLKEICTKFSPDAKHVSAILQVSGSRFASESMYGPSSSQCPVPCGTMIVIKS
jgi:hypothetical protein